MSKVSKEVKVIVFRLQNEEYGVPIDYVGSIERMLEITRIPNTPKFIKGVINLRGIVTPVIDLRERFGMETSEYSNRSRMIIVHIDDKEVGMIVDEANDVVDLSEDDIETPPEVIGSVDTDYVRGVAKLEHRLLILLNLERVLANEGVNQLSAVER